MSEMKISNTLVNDTNTGEIAYARQLKDNTVNYAQYAKITAEIKERFHLDDKFQDKLNNFFLYHYDEFHRFLEDDGVDPTIIDSWKEVKDFLEGLPDDETTWLKNKLTQLDNRITAMDIPDGGAYDISADNVDGQGNYAKYSSLSEALNAVTTDKQKPGMTVRFIQEFKPAKYTVVKTEGVTTQPTGTEIQSDPEIISGTYTAGELSVFSTLPTTLNSSLTYYLAVTETVDEQEVTTYTTWVITYAQSSDNKYVQYRLMADEWSINTNDWSFCGNDVLIENSEWIYVLLDANDRILVGLKSDGSVEWSIGIPTPVKKYIDDAIAEIKNGTEGININGLNKIITFLSDFSTSDTLKDLLDAKVDKVEGKGLSTNDYTNDDKEVVETTEIIKNSDFVEVEVDSEKKILSGRKIDGTKFENLPIEVQGVRQETIDNPEFIQVTTDSKGNIIEATKKDGKKVFYGGIEGIDLNSIPSVINIPLLNANFTSQIPVVIVGTKGNEDAKYIFQLPTKENWNLRFKFRITENLINQNKDALIASFYGGKVTVKVVPLTQHQESGTFGNVDYNDNWTTYDGGIVFNATEINSLVNPRNLGGQAFSVKYVGNGDSATIENSGTGIIVTVDGTSTTYDFTTYNTVAALFEAMSLNTDLELQYISLDQRLSSELAIFPVMSLKNIVHTGVSGSEEIYESIDSSPLYLYYAVSDKWHQVEMFRIGNTVYSVCDGFISTYGINGDNNLILGGECGVLFKDLVFHTDSIDDVEIVGNKIISSVNPYILIFECHGMIDAPYYTATPSETEDGISSLSPDTMEYYFTLLEEKGYLPVSIEDVASFYSFGTPLPKRCYVPIFDDERWSICLNNNLRRVFSRHGAKPALAIITGKNHPIYHNEVQITKSEAVDICKNANFSLVSHTKDHRTAQQILPSEYITYLTEDIYNADSNKVNGSILVYPGGRTNVYMHDVMDFLGFQIGVEIMRERFTINLTHNRFMLSRINIGSRISADGTFKNISEYTDYII